MEEEDTYSRLKEIALTKFSSIVADVDIIRGPLNVAKSLRIFFIDNSFLEVWISGKKYSYHWERRAINGKIYRHDNAPHHRNITTFPKHFHFEREDGLEDSKISDDPELAIVEFLGFIRKILQKEKGI